MNKKPLFHMVILAALATGCGKDDESDPAPVNGGGGGNNDAIAFNWSGCPEEQRPIWFAYQDGTANWTVLNSTTGSYEFNLQNNDGGVAYVIENTDGTKSTTVIHKTRAWFLSAPVNPCPSTQAWSVATGSISGTSDEDNIYVSYDGGIAATLTSGLIPDFSLTGPWSGMNDLIAYRWNDLTGGSNDNDRCIIRRGITLNSGSTIPTLDFGASEAFSLSQGNAVIAGIPNDASRAYAMGYWTGDGCEQPAAAPLYQGSTFLGVFPVAGIPTDKQLPDDLHTFRVTALLTDGQIKNVDRTFHTMQSILSINMPPSMTPPALETLSGNGLRIRATLSDPLFLLEPDMYGEFYFSYGPGSGSNSVTLIRQYPALSSADVVVEMLDFSGLAGWQSAWLPPTGSSGEWRASNQRRNGGYCEEGMGELVMRSGTY